MLPPEELKKAFPWPLASLVFSTEGHIFPLQVVGHDPNGAAVVNGEQANADSIPEDDAVRTECTRCGSAAHSEDTVSVGDSVGSPWGERPLLTCEALTPFERVAVQRRCATKYVLTQTYQQQTMGRKPRHCRPQTAVVEVQAELRGGAMEQAQFPLWVYGKVSSLGPPLVALPVGLEDIELTATANPSITHARPQTVDNATCRGKCGWEGPAAAAEASVELPLPLEGELGLTRLDLDLPPGQLPPFTGRGAKVLQMRRFLASRPLVEADPPEACEAVDEDSDRYDGRLVLVRRGGCLFLRKLLVLQKARAAGVVVVNREGDQELQVMTCPLQDRGAGKEANIPSLMISLDDGQQLRSLLAKGPLVARLFSLQ